MVGDCPGCVERSAQRGRWADLPVSDDAPRQGIDPLQRRKGNIQLATLVRQRGLCQVQAFGGVVQAVHFPQGVDGAQVSQVDHGQNFNPVQNSET